MKLMKKEKRLLKIMGVVAFIVIYSRYLVMPLYFKLLPVQVEKKVVEEQLNMARNAADTEKIIDKRIALEKEKASTFYNKYFASATQEELVLMLNEFTKAEPKANEISFSEFKTLDINNMQFQGIDANLLCVGSYESVTKLLRTIWAFPKHISVDSVELGTAENGTVSSKIKMVFCWVPNTRGNNDAIVRWIPDESFYKADPYNLMAGDPNYVNYVFLGGDSNRLEELFNKPFSDISGHWAEKEIDDFRQNGYVVADSENRFKPDEPMTRGEFVIMLDKIYQWPAPEGNVDLTTYTDYNTLGSYEGPIAKAIYKGYMGGYVIGFTDNTLRPRDPITYDEMTYIMSRVKNNADFSWIPVGEKLLAEKSVRSQGLSDLKKPMSRAEVVYLMTYFK